MTTQTGGRVRGRGHAGARSHHPTNSSLLLPGTIERVPEVRVPVAPVPAVARADSTADDGASLSAPALALLAAAAIFEGYRWLHLIPGSPSVPDIFFFAAIAAAITFGLACPAVWTKVGPVRRVAWAGACALVGGALLVPLIRVPVTDPIVGTVSLVLAVAALLGVFSRERQRRADQPTGTDRAH